MRLIPFGKPLIDDAEKQAVLNVLDGPILVHGPVAKNFETDFATFCHAPHAVSVSSCTAGMHLYYFHLGLGAGDEVLVPAQTHTATAHAVELCGAKPVFIDAEIHTGNVDLEQLEAAITPRTRAIAVVHYLGMPVQMEQVMSLARQHDLKVVEDCALAFGTYSQGRHAGLWGDMGCFSFYPVKHMTTAEGGMIICQDAVLAEQLTRKRAFGVDRTPGERKVPGVYDVTMLGFNYRMNELQAAIGIEQLKKLPGFLKQRQANYHRLYNALTGLEGLDLFRLPDPEHEASSYYCLSVLLTSDLAAKRLEFVQYLNQRGIGTSIYYPAPVPHMSYYREKYGYTLAQFPVAARISYQSIALPVGPHLNADDMDYIAQEIASALTQIKE